MKRLIVYYKPEYKDIALKLQDSYQEAGRGVVDIISEEEQDDVEYARVMQYDEAIFIEEPNTVIIHDI